jgi:hypothetical protein
MGHLYHSELQVYQRVSGTIEFPTSRYFLLIFPDCFGNLRDTKKEISGNIMKHVSQNRLLVWKYPRDTNGNRMG